MLNEHECAYIFELVFTFSSDTQKWNCLMILQSIFNFEATSYCFLYWLHQFTIPSTVHKDSQPPPSLPTLISFFIRTILTGGKWYVIAVLICISLMISNIEHLFMYLLATCMSSLEKMSI